MQQGGAGDLLAPMDTSVSPSALHLLYVVEDDEAVRSALTLIARCEGWSVRAFASGVEFLESPLDERGACLVLDINLPVMNGMDVLRRLRARGSRLPVLAVTGDRLSADLDSALAAGAQGVLYKPFDLETFVQAVRDCWSCGHDP